MTDAPFRRQFDAARDPYAARNALGISGTGGSGGGAPIDAEYIVAVDDPTLTNDRVLTNTATVTWDLATAGQVKANAVGGGNVSNSGTPSNLQYARWTDATHIAGVAPATVLSDIGAAPIASPTFTGDPKAPTPTAGDNDTSVATTAFVMAAIAAIPGATTVVTPPQGRLTLQPGVPVMTTTQSSKATIYYTPYVGNMVPIYDGTNMVMTTFAELNMSTLNSANNPAVIGASKVNDWFVWNDAGTIRLCHGSDWFSDTDRGALGITRINGIWTNSFAISNGPAQNRGTYVGTTFSDASSKLNFIYGALAAGGLAGHFDVWNAYNRINFISQCLDSADSWTVSSASWTGHSATFANFYTCGLAEDMTESEYYAIVAAGTPGFTSWGIGSDTTSIYSGITGYTPASQVGTGPAHYGVAAIGQRRMTGIEVSGVGGTVHTYFGDAGAPGQMQGGLVLRWRG